MTAILPVRTDPRIAVSYSRYSEESALAGFHDEQGWVDEEGWSALPDCIDLADNLTAVDKAILFLRDEGVFEPSSMPFHPGVWYCSEPSQDYGSGEWESRSYHLKGFTEDEERCIYVALFPRWILPPA